jgi:hypothetical protein
MKMNDVKIGSEYEARIAGGTVQVRILAEKASGGWTAQNLATKKKVFVPLARQLREPDTTAMTTTDGNLTVVEVPPATVEMINAPNAKPARKKKATNEPAEPAKKISQIEAAIPDPGEIQRTHELPGDGRGHDDPKGLWTSPGGKTPHATLYASILREINTKGKDARFKKVDRGQFVATGVGGVTMTTTRTPRLRRRSRIG